MQYLEIPMQVTVEDLGATVSDLNVLQRRLKVESNEDESLWELAVTNCHRGHFKLHNELIKEQAFWLCFHFNKIHGCVEKASSTAAKQNHMTANSHQLSFSFDLVFRTFHYF